MIYSEDFIYDEYVKFEKWHIEQTVVFASTIDAIYSYYENESPEVPIEEMIDFYFHCV